VRLKADKLSKLTQSGKLFHISTTLLEKKFVLVVTRTRLTSGIRGSYRDVSLQSVNPSVTASTSSVAVAAADNAVSGT